MPEPLNLASRRLGTSVLAASDDSFGEMENLVLDAEPEFVPGRFGNRGEIVDGWETRRGAPGQDWALVRLGVPGTVSAVDIDTRFFTGNYPPEAAVEGTGREGYPSVEDLLAEDTGWETVLPRTSLKGNSRNVFDVPEGTRWTHLRLRIFPDGGVARLRAYGRPVPDPRLLDGLTIDLAAAELGADVEASSDDFYYGARSLLAPGGAATMGEGWETQRRRDGGHDWVVLRLAAEGVPEVVEVDTAHFKYNATRSFALSGAACLDGETPAPDSPLWHQVLARTPLQPDTRHRFRLPAGTGGVTHVRLDAFPDGGIARVRVHGAPTAAGRGRLGRRWFDSLPPAHALAVLVACGLDAREAAALAASRPIATSEEPAVRALLDGDTADCGTRRI